tara:strand:+ start:2238 stop:2378 length:141 start_codon:yes stop_codon:yes gene_type:complete
MLDCLELGSQEKTDQENRRKDLSDVREGKFGSANEQTRKFLQVANR